MELLAAIKAFNRARRPQIKLSTTRDGRVTAVLPRLGREIIVKDSDFKEEVKVTVSDLALLCEEARQASAPGMALLEAALSALNALEQPTERSEGNDSAQAS